MLTPSIRRTPSTAIGVQVGDCIGEMALLPGSVYLSSTKALSPVIVLVIYREELFDLAAQHAPLMRSIVGWLARRIISSQCFTPRSQGSKRQQEQLEQGKGQEQGQEQETNKGSRITVPPSTLGGVGLRQRRATANSSS